MKATIFVSAPQRTAIISQGDIIVRYCLPIRFKIVVDKYAHEPILYR